MAKAQPSGISTESSPCSTASPSRLDEASPTGSVARRSSRLSVVPLGSEGDDDDDDSSDSWDSVPVDSTSASGQSQAAPATESFETENQETKGMVVTQRLMVENQRLQRRVVALERKLSGIGEDDLLDLRDLSTTASRRPSRHSMRAGSFSSSDAASSQPGTPSADGLTRIRSDSSCGTSSPRTEALLADGLQVWLEEGVCPGKPHSGRRTQWLRIDSDSGCSAPEAPPAHRRSPARAHDGRRTRIDSDSTCSAGSSQPTEAPSAGRPERQPAPTKGALVEQQQERRAGASAVEEGRPRASTCREGWKRRLEEKRASRRSLDSDVLEIKRFMDRMEVFSARGIIDAEHATTLRELSANIIDENRAATKVAGTVGEDRSASSPRAAVVKHLSNLESVMKAGMLVMEDRPLAEGSWWERLSVSCCTSRVVNVNFPEVELQGAHQAQTPQRPSRQRRKSVPRARAISSEPEDDALY